MAEPVTHRSVPHGTPHPRADQLGETLRLATEIADDAARSDIEMMCPCERVGAIVWYDLAGMLVDDSATRRLIDKAERYLQLRGRIEPHPNHATWVRFRA